MDPIGRLVLISEAKTLLDAESKEFTRHVSRVCGSVSKADSGRRVDTDYEKSDERTRPLRVERTAPELVTPKTADKDMPKARRGRSPKGGNLTGMAVAFPDVLSATSKVMRANKGKNTKPEMVVRRLAHGMGYRYRLHRKDLPGSPDLVFGPRRKVIFVHGCFWHQHPDPGCKIARMPKSRLYFWRPKLEANRSRDDRDTKALENMGWRVLTLWECGLRDRERTCTLIQSFLRDSDEGPCCGRLNFSRVRAG